MTKGPIGLISRFFIDMNKNLIALIRLPISFISCVTGIHKGQPTSWWFYSVLYASIHFLYQIHICGCWCRNKNWSDQCRYLAFEFLLVKSNISLDKLRLQCPRRSVVSAHYNPITLASFCITKWASDENINCISFHLSDLPLNQYDGSSSWISCSHGCCCRLKRVFSLSSTSLTITTISLTQQTATMEMTTTKNLSTIKQIQLMQWTKTTQTPVILRLRT